jgi:zinc D-Ala-D-Ala carboxypeptidase
MKKFDIFDALEFFKRSEFENPDGMGWELLLRLDVARRLADTPFTLTSTFRASDARSHGKGLAVDIHCIHSGVRYKILNSLLAAGFNRIGIYANHIHVDLDSSLPGELVWYGTYPKDVGK